MAPRTDLNRPFPDLVARRLFAQGLAGPPGGSALEVARRLLAVQGQDPRGARLSIRSRSTGLTADDVDRALTQERSAVITWVNHGTLHLIAAEDYWWLHPLTTPQLVVGNARRLRQEGVSPAQADAGVDVVRAAVEAGPQTRAQLRDRLDALARLARRYLVGHGPATAQDLAKWAGITLGDARLGLAGIAGELTDGLAAGLTGGLTGGLTDGPTTARSRWSTGGRSRPGAWPGAWCPSSRSSRCPPRSRARSTGRRSMSCGSCVVLIVSESPRAAGQPSRAAPTPGISWR